MIMLQTYEGYFEDGRFHQTSQAVRIAGRRRAFITILDEPARDENQRQAEAMRRFREQIRNCAEPVPEFERVKLREVEV